MLTEERSANASNGVNESMKTSTVGEETGVGSKDSKESTDSKETSDRSDASEASLRCRDGVNGGVDVAEIDMTEKGPANDEV